MVWPHLVASKFFVVSEHSAPKHKWQVLSAVKPYELIASTDMR